MVRCLRWKFRCLSVLFMTSFVFGGLTAEPEKVSAQSITIMDPGANQDYPGGRYDCLGKYSFTAGQANTIDLKMYEVNSSDQIVGDPVDQDTLTVSAGQDAGWGIGVDFPNIHGTLKRYKIIVRLLLKVEGQPDQQAATASVYFYVGGS